MGNDSLVADYLFLDFIMPTRNSSTAAIWHVGFGLHVT